MCTNTNNNNSVCESKLSACEQPCPSLCFGYFEVSPACVLDLDFRFFHLSVKENMPLMFQKYALLSLVRHYTNNSEKTAVAVRMIMALKCLKSQRLDSCLTLIRLIVTVFSQNEKRAWVYHWKTLLGLTGLTWPTVNWDQLSCNSWLSPLFWRSGSFCVSKVRPKHHCGPAFSFIFFDRP